MPTLCLTMNFCRENTEMKDDIFFPQRGQSRKGKSQVNKIVIKTSVDWVGIQV